MPKRNAMEAIHPEHLLMSKIIHMKAAAVGDSGEKCGDHMATHPPNGQKILDQTDFHDKVFPYA